MKTIKTLLVTRPNYDPTTHYCYHWSQSVIEKAKEKSYHVLDLVNEKVTKGIFESYLRKHEPDFLFLNGHGSPTVFTGQNDEHILADENSHIIPNGAIMYVRSCDVGSVLGKTLAQRASVFIGYSKSFGFYRDSRYMRNPIDDPLAKFSFEPSNLVVTTLIKGKTAGEAHQRSQKMMQKTMQYLLSSKASDRERQCALLLWRNYKHQVLIGNPSARLSS